MKNRSSETMWAHFTATNPIGSTVPNEVVLWDDQNGADTAVEQVLNGTKNSTSLALLLLQLQNRPLPKIREHSVICNFKGEPFCIVETTSVKLVPFFSIREAFALQEGYKSLDAWKTAHWNRFERELATFDRRPNESMIVVCEHFKKVFQE
ncbi:MAG: ASCH domain-containing protein [Sediminicola sp.]